MRKLGAAFLVASVFAISAAPVDARPKQLQASIAPTATVVEGGAAVIVDVTVLCPGGSHVLEAFVYVTQDGQQSQFVGIPIRCGGKARTYQVRVPAPEGTTFHTGTASASGFVLVEKKGATSSVSPSQALTIS